MTEPTANQLRADLLARYRELQSLEGATLQSEHRIAQEQGEVWRAYVALCLRDGVEPETDESPRLGDL